MQTGCCPTWCPGVVSQLPASLQPVGHQGKHYNPPHPWWHTPLGTQKTMQQSQFSCTNSLAGGCCPKPAVGVWSKHKPDCSGSRL
jgi:hypothetical protein